MGHRYYDELSRVTMVFMLVDYDNAKATAARERSDAQARASLQRLLDSADRFFTIANLSPKRTFFELYGGWRNPDGLPSEDHQRLSRVIPDFARTKAGGSWASFALVEALREPTETLVGTRDSGDQKMVDGMLVLDTVARARELKDATAAIVVVSADVDVLPGIVLAAEVSGGRLPLFLLRLLLGHDTRKDDRPQDKHLVERAAVLSLRR